MLSFFTSAKPDTSSDKVVPEDKPVTDNNSCDIKIDVSALSNIVNDYNEKEKKQEQEQDKPEEQPVVANTVNEAVDIPKDEKAVKAFSDVLNQIKQEGVKVCSSKSLSAVEILSDKLKALQTEVLRLKEMQRSINTNAYHLIDYEEELMDRDYKLQEKENLYINKRIELQNREIALQDKENELLEFNNKLKIRDNYQEAFDKYSKRKEASLLDQEHYLKGMKEGLAIRQQELKQKEDKLERDILEFQDRVNSVPNYNIDNVTDQNYYNYLNTYFSGQYYQPVVKDSAYLRNETMYNYFYNGYYKLVAFVNTFRRLPMKYVQSELSLWTWCNEIRQMEKDGKLDNEYKLKLQSIVGWYWLSDKGTYVDFDLDDEDSEYDDSQDNKVYVGYNAKKQNYGSSIGQINFKLFDESHRVSNNKINNLTDNSKAALYMSAQPKYSQNDDCIEDYSSDDLDLSDDESDLSDCMSSCSCGNDCPIFNSNLKKQAPVVETEYEYSDDDDCIEELNKLVDSINRRISLNRG